MPNETALRGAAWLLVRLAWGWTLMLLTHEAGHLIAAAATGAVVVHTNLLPWVLPYTLVEHNPHPHVVAWGGVAGGVGLPLLAWGVLKGIRSPAAPTGAGLAGFCLLTNGVYLAVGGGETLTDSGVLLALGWPNAILIAGGLLLAAPGYWISRRDLLAQLARVQRGDVGWRRVGGTLIGWMAAITCQAVLAFACGADGLD